MQNFEVGWLDGNDVIHLLVKEEKMRFTDTAVYTKGKIEKINKLHECNNCRKIKINLHKMNIKKNLAKELVL